MGGVSAANPIVECDAGHGSREVDSQDGDTAEKLAGTIQNPVGDVKRSSGKGAARLKTALGNGAELTYQRVQVRKEIFVCDHCGARKRLDSAQRHWCEECTTSKPVELRPARDKRPVEAIPETQTVGR